MSNKKNLKSEQTFATALQNHKENNIKLAKKLYNATLKIDPYYVDAYNNLGILQNQLGGQKKNYLLKEKIFQLLQKLQKRKVLLRRKIHSLLKILLS